MIAGAVHNTYLGQASPVAYICLVASQRRPGPPNDQNRERSLYAAFNVKVDKATVQAMDSAGTRFREILQSSQSSQSAKTKPSIQGTLKSMLDPDGMVNADRMRQNWFPELKCHVFLSHSHADKELADDFVQLMARRFGITCFVDADVWGYIGDLQKAIDDRWGKSKGSYSYPKLQATSAHVHMLLLSALARMMDNCECLMFLNTPASVPTSGTADASKTYSSWIYGEVALSSIIRRRTLKDHRHSTVIAKMEALEEDFPPFKYDLSLEHMHDLGKDKLIKWSKQRSASATASLNSLYDLFEANI